MHLYCGLLALLVRKYQFWHLRAPGAVVALMSAGALAHGGAAADGETCVDLALKGKHGSILVHMLQVLNLYATNEASAN